MRQWRLSEQGFDGQREAPREDSFCGAAVDKGTMLVVEDAASDWSRSVRPWVSASLVPTGLR